ncbi:MAG: DUF2062 domain-containing protein [Cyanobacteria bacterium]|nr:DUF2062 domain-containing protein [Cyanobacteria bacterium CG_2015-16_32_12]NCO79129.1 DUF2062 domain-containing protein [Cyanobacteria bacterium CG_2015-22_32_23]NCQ05238.1 DUF2062 domain-containing protein [Cyanobacteria bacterium CG_2015-09_32_10]NCQ42459.1 DUF2062 domain-containing protein [Cyanobacteria bacterium CG_2015-04_32_10]NCS86025.1 DUF2062 domain-containing protein [Cyanobacteria bacterium CG_2015-02_32_10]
MQHNVKKRRKSLSIKRYWHYYKLRLLRLKENPHKIARGFAAGVFAGCFPLMGLQFVMAIIFAFILKGNKFTAIIGTWISNPFTYVPLFLFNFQVGKFCLSFFIDNHHIEFSWDSLKQISDLGTEITTTLLLGSFIVGLCFSFVAYYVILYLLKKWKKIS